MSLQSNSLSFFFVCKVFTSLKSDIATEVKAQTSMNETFNSSSVHHSFYLSKYVFQFTWQPSPGLRHIIRICGKAAALLWIHGSYIFQRLDYRTPCKQGGERKIPLIPEAKAAENSLLLPAGQSWEKKEARSDTAREGGGCGDKHCLENHILWMHASKCIIISANTESTFRSSSSVSHVSQQCHSSQADCSMAATWQPGCI